MPRLLAPSISSTSTSSPALMLRQMSHSLQGAGVGPLLAVQRLGQDPGGRGLADAAGPGEQIGMAHAVRGDGVREGLGDVLLADQLVERLRPIAPRDDDVLRAREPAGAESVDSAAGSAIDDQRSEHAAGDAAAHGVVPPTLRAGPG